MRFDRRIRAWVRLRRCVCGEHRIFKGSTLELWGVKHRLDGPCFMCDAYGNAAEQETPLQRASREVTEQQDAAAKFECPDCGGTSGPDWNVAICSTCKGTGMVHNTEQETLPLPKSAKQHDDELRRRGDVTP